MTTYNILLFDLDGTLTESHIGIIKSFQFALRKMGIDEPKAENLIKHVGPPFQETLKNFYGMQPADVDKAVGFFRQRFKEKGMFENVLYPRIPSLLEKLKQEDKTLVIATSKLTAFAEGILRYFKIDHYFDFVEGSSLEGNTKAEVIQQALIHFPGVDKKDFIMIGDRNHDIIGARNAGIDSIAVTYGYGSVEEFKNAQPTFIANSVEEIERILNVSFVK
ncbi:HAD hydrolase-like protein [Peribacillus frigoritolerans]|uniref:HAD hydrolase-like protein n=1 Tax=Peribacillus frigoritolerans TaxID=450367 RepID=UPI003D082FB3